MAENVIANLSNPLTAAAIGVIGAFFTFFGIQLAKSIKRDSGLRDSAQISRFIQVSFGILGGMFFVLAILGFFLHARNG